MRQADPREGSASEDEAILQHRQIEAAAVEADDAGARRQRLLEQMQLGTLLAGMAHEELAHHKRVGSPAICFPWQRKRPDADQERVRAGVRREAGGLRVDEGCPRRIERGKRTVAARGGERLRLNVQQRGQVRPLGQRVADGAHPGRAVRGVDGLAGQGGESGRVGERRLGSLDPRCGALRRGRWRTQVGRAALHAELAQAFEAGESVGAIVGSGHANQQMSESATERSGDAQLRSDSASLILGMCVVLRYVKRNSRRLAKV